MMWVLENRRKLYSHGIAMEMIKIMGTVLNSLTLFISGVAREYHYLLQ